MDLNVCLRCGEASFPLMRQAHRSHGAQIRAHITAGAQHQHNFLIGIMGPEYQGFQILGVFTYL